VGEKEEPQVRVVDRRWWARGDAGDTAETGGDDRVRKPSVIEDLEQQLADRTAQIQTQLTERRRMLEEFEQVKARLRRDTAREIERGKRSVLIEMLDVVDNLDRAIAAASQSPTPDQALFKGVQLVRDQFLAKLQGLGVTRIDALGQPFDAVHHEAISTMPVTDPTQDGNVVSVVREGYAIGDELLRPAAVVVGKAG
jgi:molecular chaperone GrpE